MVDVDNVCSFSPLDASRTSRLMSDGGDERDKSCCKKVAPTYPVAPVKNTVFPWLTGGYISYSYTSCHPKGTNSFSI